MGYDIYGQKLASGHCEVHPHIAEQYPCSLCYAESEQERHYQYQQKKTDNREAEYYAEMERAHCDEIAKKNNWLYRVLCYVAPKLNFVNERLQKYKEKVFNDTMTKCA